MPAKRVIARAWKVAEPVNVHHIDTRVHPISPALVVDGKTDLSVVRDDDTELHQLASMFTVALKLDGEEQQPTLYVWPEGDGRALRVTCEQVTDGEVVVRVRSNTGDVSGLRVPHKCSLAREGTHLPDSISVVWSIEDFDEVAPQLTDRQRRRALALVLEAHDCNDGITWESLRAAADQIREEDEKNA